MNDRQTELKEHSAHIFEMGCMEQRVYLMNDADAVIEAKDAEIAKMNAKIEEQESEIAELKESVKGLILDNYLKDKELRSQKYKRCLTMASYWVAVSYQCVDDKHRQRAKKHHYEWLKIAEKFKEAK